MANRIHEPGQTRVMSEVEKAYFVLMTSTDESARIASAKLLQAWGEYALLRIACANDGSIKSIAAKAANK